MLEIKKIRENAKQIIKGLNARGIADAETTIQHLVNIDKDRRENIQNVEQLKAKGNAAAKSIGKLMAEGKKDEANLAKEVASQSKAEIKRLEESIKSQEDQQESILLNLPNTPDSSVPIGSSEQDNLEISRHGTFVEAPKWAKPHWDLATELDIIDWELGAKITGSGFPVYKGQGAKFLRALIQFFLDEAEDAGYKEMVPPLLVNEASGYGTGQLPDKEGQMYHVTGDNLYLIPTAEVPLTNLYRDVIVNNEDLPIQNCGYTQCFRREAGAYGSHVRGLNRLHQFDKVEIIEIVRPEESYARLEKMLGHVRNLLDKLELPHRILLLCTGDMGFTSAKTFDLEVFSSAQKRWLEVSSISNFETYQSNRLKLRFRHEKKNQLVHTLNGSALALPRIMAALMENNQNEDGSIDLPKVLHRYLRFEKLTKS
ncbi:MAG TPA: serine--tRNA ligase [Bacteroidetes bacterium]|nr:serine--tRNA ligase [Bacteroidota bacterium]